MATVNLNQAAPFAILAGSGITFTGAANSSTVNGDIGTYPTLTINGIGNVVLNGTNSPSSTVAIAQTALNQAYIDVASSTPATTITSDLGTFNGGTLLPGVYNSGSSIGLTGTVTLDGQGDPNAVFIFQAGSTLTTASNSTIKLINGAQACNVFWQVGSSATLGTYSTFNGNILASDSITDNGYSTVNGRFLAKNAAVTLNNSVLTSATCATPHTLHVIKNVVGSTALPSDFMIAVNSSNFSTSTLGTSTPGTAYSLLDGTYTVSESANPSYTQSFSGDCNSSGQVTGMGADKICTVTNTYITPTQTSAPVSSGGGSGPAPVTPAIGITKTASPLALPNGSGLVTYNYTVWNVGRNISLANVTITDDKCAPVTLVSGDINNNFKIEANETWQYTCATTLANTTTNTATATGYSDDVYHQKTTATATATVVVGASSITSITSTSTPVVTSIVKPVIIATTTPITNSATKVIPLFPNTGIIPEGKNTPWNIIIPIGTLMLVLTSLTIVLKKSKN